MAIVTPADIAINMTIHRDRYFCDYYETLNPKPCIIIIIAIIVIIVIITSIIIVIIVVIIIIVTIIFIR